MSLLRRNDVATAFRRNNDVIITACVHWVAYWIASVFSRICVSICWLQIQHVISVIMFVLRGFCTKAWVSNMHFHFLCHQSYWYCWWFLLPIGVNVVKNHLDCEIWVVISNEKINFEIIWRPRPAPAPTPAPRGPGYSQQTRTFDVIIPHRLPKHD